MINTNYKIKIIRSLQGIKKNEFDLLDINSGYSSYEWLIAIEQRPFINVSYVTVTAQDGKLLMVVPCYLETEPYLYSSYNTRDILMGSDIEYQINKYGSPNQIEDFKKNNVIINNCIGIRPVKSLICSTREGYAASANFLNMQNKNQLNCLTRKVINIITQIGESLGCTFISFLYLDASNNLFQSLISDKRYTKFRQPPTAYLKLKWENFDEYLDSFSSHRRNAIRRDIKRYEQGRIISSIRRLEELSTSTLASLLNQTINKYEFNQDKSKSLKWCEDYINHLKIIKLPNYVFIALLDEEVVGFSLWFHYRDSFLGRVVGFDYSKLGHTSLCYQNIAFYYPIFHAIELKIKRLEFGLGTLETKVFRGCGLLQNFSFVFSPFINKKEIFSNVEIIDEIHNQELSHLKNNFSCPTYSTPKLNE